MTIWFWTFFMYSEHCSCILWTYQIPGRKSNTSFKNSECWFEANFCINGPLVKHCCVPTSPFSPSLQFWTYGTQQCLIGCCYTGIKRLEPIQYLLAAKIWTNSTQASICPSRLLAKMYYDCTENYFEHFLTSGRAILRLTGWSRWAP